MTKIKLGKEFFIAAFIALICAVFILCNFYQDDVFIDARESIVKNDVESLDLCVSKMWDIDMIGPGKQTLLMVACENGSVDAIEYLINHGADVNKSPSGCMTPLELYCSLSYEAGEYGLLLLIDSNVKQSKYTVKPAVFHLADQYYWMNDSQKALATEETIWLLKYGAPLGYNNTSLLHMAAKGNMGDLFYTIVHTTQGLSMLNMKDENGQTPWEIAVEYGAVSVQKVIRNLETELKEEEENGSNIGSTNPDDIVDEDAPLGSVDNPYPDGYFDDNDQDDYYDGEEDWYYEEEATPTEDDEWHYYDNVDDFFNGM